MKIRSTFDAPFADPHLAYRRALSHSAHVKRLKILLPVLAVTISLAFVAVSWVRAIFPDNLSIGGARIENGRVVMEKPAISGRNDEGISYFMNAARALQSIANPSDIALETIEAAVPIRSDLIARVTATAANFDRDSDRLDMTAPFVVTLSSGIKANFKSAHLDVHAGILASKEPVTVTAKESTLVANSMNITDKGRVIGFSGNVRLTLNPAAFRSKQNQGQ
ncbi:LPS export ABC transporter periplasmic protein LptC [Rhizobium sp. G21]|uniref:LPS export ABC transporter periplasmic protein LptC n=1 Tax=Rhizobium sp. G21 TaxID=2758439 RepID=UPI001602E6E6|nr:LPS export ABC transporter periplasmic protein LptC [Rhizobium sp. G21]MBB1249226.1 LPS export ABC transporter periplasmic protein LptC [Rhizobium sp. G21]